MPPALLSLLSVWTAVVGFCEYGSDQSLTPALRRLNSTTQHNTTQPTQDERRSQLNGGKAGGAYTGSQRYAGTHAAIAGAPAPDGNDFYDDLSNASAPPAAALTPGNPADKAQRKAALERERVAAAVAWEDDQRRAQQRAAGAAAAPVEKSTATSTRFRTGGLSRSRLTPMMLNIPLPCLSQFSL